MSTYVPAGLRRRIRARFVDRCAYCRTAEALIAAVSEIEYIIPRGVSGVGHACQPMPPLPISDAMVNSSLTLILRFYSTELSGDQRPDKLV
jgi:hypothetical protein